MNFNMIRKYAGFSKHFILSPKTIGAICPSSPYLCNQMTSIIQLNNINVAAELGAGNGSMTLKILSHLPQSSQLDVYEIKKEFAHELRQIEDSRLVVINDSAENLNRRYDAIFSGLPFLSLGKGDRESILCKINQHLMPNGYFILFQYTPLLEKELSRYFLWSRRFVLYNIPPAFVYLCRKKVSIIDIGSEVVNQSIVNQGKA